MTPTFEEYMLVNGMNDPYRLRPDLLEKWQAKYARVYPATPAHVAPAVVANSAPNPLEAIVAAPGKHAEQGAI